MMLSMPTSTNCFMIFPNKIENQEDRLSTGAYVDYVLIIKYIERMADHGTNIGEWVVYQKNNELPGRPNL